MSFIHLHSHSHYSLLDGVPKIPELIAAAKKRGMNALALTDHGNMYGAIEFYEEAKKAGIKPIIGLEAYVTNEPLDARNPSEQLYHLILLAKNTQGYKNLVKLCSISHINGFYYKPRIDMETLKQYSDGLIALSGCLSGEIAKTILSRGVEDAVPVAQKYCDIFGKENFFLEMQKHPSLPQQATVNEGLLQLREKLDIPIVATADSHYIERDDAEAQDVMLCIQTKKLLADTDRMTLRNENLSFTTTEEMRERFSDIPEAVDITQTIADSVNIEIELGKTQLPYFNVPEGITPEVYLRKMCEKGLEERYETVTEEIRQRLEYELDIINKTGFASYFLITQDFINWSKQQSIAVGPGRGSAAGSIVAYLTNITDVDPIKYKLLFERFLNPERISMPDIDTDFADIRRDDVLHYVEEKYGKDHVAQIITFGTMAARAAIRDVGRVLGLSYGYCDRLAKLIPMFTTLDEALATVPELSELVNQDTDAERLISIAKKLEGVVRHTSTHACAVVITKEPLDTSVPLQRDQDDGSIITQYSMKPIDDLGLLKMDFLGLKNLTIIEQSLAIIKATTGDEVLIDKIPLDDKKTYALLKKADTIGVFQLESSGMRRYLKQLKPTEIEDIIAMVSLYRPGPMEFIPQYIDGKHGKRTITYINERLKPILSKTYGIAVYQEQVMEIALQLAGFTYGEADVLRKAVGKKIKSLLDEQEHKMIQGMVNNGIHSSVAKEIWEFILPFARYGFNRSHAACYALIAYRTAYLKANYPAQFMAALLTADYGNSERVALEVKHAKEMGIEVLPPDINESFGTFSVVKDRIEEGESHRIRFGLKAIKNVGEHIITVIISERKENGPYTTLENFLQRVQDKDLNKKSLESLIKCGALDCFGERNLMLMNIDVLLQFAKRAQLERDSGQTNLFGGLDESTLPKLTLSPAQPIDQKIQLNWEKELLGLFVSGHPLDRYSAQLREISKPFAELREHPKREALTLIGIVLGNKRIYTKKGDAMLFVSLADDTAEIEAIIFPKIYTETLTLWENDSIVEVTGKLNDKDGTLKIIVDSASLFNPEKLNRTIPKKIVISVPREIKKTIFTELQSILMNSTGTIPVYLLVDEKEIDTKHTIDLDTVPKIEKLFGRENVDMVE